MTWDLLWMGTAVFMLIVGIDWRGKMDSPDPAREFRNAVRVLAYLPLAFVLGFAPPIMILYAMGYFQP